MTARAGTSAAPVSAIRGALASVAEERSSPEGGQTLSDQEQELARIARSRSRRNPLRYAFWRLRETLSAAPFEETFYLHVYPDVGADLAGDGPFVTAFEHYVRSGAAEGRQSHPTPSTEPPAAERPALDLEGSSRIDHLFLELTSKCNLRCVYCPVSQPTYRGMHLYPGHFDEAIDAVVASGAQVIQLNGHGESTIVKGWEVIADRLADRGIRLQLTTNLAKKLRPAEIAALSRFERINVSIDTVDHELSAEMRRGSEVPMILDNLTAIREHALARRRPLEIAVSCVVSAQTAIGLDDLARELLERGATHFRFADLNEYPALPDAIHARHVSSLDAKTHEQARSSFRAALERIEAANAEVEVDPPLRAALLEDRAAEEEVRAPKSGEKRLHYERVPEGQTRDCLDPWRVLFLHATGEMRPCCFYEESLTSYHRVPLIEDYNSEAFRSLRRSLLEGELSPSCASCSTRGLVSREVLAARVEDYLRTGSDPVG